MGEIVILFVAMIILWFLKGNIIAYGKGFYDLLWIFLLSGFCLLFFLRPRTKAKKTTFPEAELKKIEKRVPHQAISLMPWFVETLNKVYAALLSEIKETKTSEFVADFVSAIEIKFSKIQKIGLYQLLENKSRDNAFIAMVFFMVLINDLIKHSPARILNKKVSPYRWAMSFISLDIAPKYLGKESFRFYELARLTTNNFDDLIFNSDLSDLFKKVFLAEASKAQVLLASKTSKNEKALEIIKNFEKWLQRQLKKELINQGQRYFQDLQNYGNKYLFIVDEVLNRYLKASKQSKHEFLLMLKQQEVLDNGQFVFKQKNEKNLSIHKIKISFKTEVLVTLAGEIVMPKPTVMEED